MIVCYLGMLAGLFGVPLFMQFGGLPVRFSRFIVVCCCFVVVVFRHYGYYPSIPMADTPPCFRAALSVVLSRRE